jgi:hypothetical protein
MITENLSTLKIHTLTQAQYERARENGTLEQYALYLTPDEDGDFATIEQVNAALAEAKAYADSLIGSILNGAS